MQQPESLKEKNRKMSPLKILMAFGMFAPLVSSINFVRGSNCGIFTEIKTMDKLPEDFSQLECVIVKDPVSFKRYTDSIPGWGNYSQWTPCTASCNGGLRWRTRICKNATHQLDPSDCGGGEELIENKCNTETCIVHGGWSDWSYELPCPSWSTGRRSRSCVNPTPTEDPPGDDCVGPAEEVVPCPDEPCQTGLSGVHWFGTTGYALTPSLKFFKAREHCHKMFKGANLMTINEQAEHDIINETVYALGETGFPTLWMNFVNDDFITCTDSGCVNQLFWQDKTPLNPNVFSGVEAGRGAYITSLCGQHFQGKLLDNGCWVANRAMCEVECFGVEECPKDKPFAINNGNHCCNSRITEDSSCTSPLKGTDPILCCNSSSICPNPPCVNSYLAKDICDVNKHSRKISGTNTGVIIDPFTYRPMRDYSNFSQYCSSLFGGTPMEFRNKDHLAAAFYIIRDALDYLGLDIIMALPINEPDFNECLDLGQCVSKFSTQPLRWTRDNSAVDHTIFTTITVNKLADGNCMALKVLKNEDSFGLQSIGCSDSWFLPCLVTECKLA